MARVLENVPRVEKTLVCPHCGRTIGYVSNDVKDYYSRDIGGGGDTTYYLHCPSPDCGKQINISWRDK